MAAGRSPSSSCRARKSRRSSCRWSTSSSACPAPRPTEVEERVTAPAGTAAVGDPRRRVRLLDLESGGSRWSIVRFKVGEDEERGLVRLNQKLAAEHGPHPARRDAAAGASRARSTTCRSWPSRSQSARYGDDQLRALAGAAARRGRRRCPTSRRSRSSAASRGSSRVDARPGAARRLRPRPAGACAGARARQPRTTASGPVDRRPRDAASRPATFLHERRRRARASSSASRGGRPVLVRDVAAVVDGDAEPANYVRASQSNGATAPTPAVTLAVAKRKGTNAIDVGRPA